MRIIYYVVVIIPMIVVMHLYALIVVFFSILNCYIFTNDDINEFIFEHIPLSIRRAIVLSKKKNKKRK